MTKIFFGLYLWCERGILYGVYELLEKFPEKIIGAELAALALNLVSNSKNADKIASEGRAKNLIERALTNSDFELIKIVKNIIKYSDKEEINDIYEKYINKHFIKIVLAKSENQEFLIELIENINIYVSFVNSSDN